MTYLDWGHGADVRVLCVCKTCCVEWKNVSEGEENLAIRKLCENKVGTLFVLCFYLSDFHLWWKNVGEHTSCLFTSST